MNRYKLLIKARRCHGSANAIRVHATSAPYASRKDAMHEWEIAHNLEAMADKLERQAIAHLPRRKATVRLATHH
jgi:hypothetical protein